MEPLEIKLLNEYTEIRSHMNDLIAGNYIEYELTYELLTSCIESFIYDLAYINDKNVIRAYYEQLLNDSKIVSNSIYTFVITLFDDNEWRF